MALPINPENFLGQKVVIIFPVNDLICTLWVSIPETRRNFLSRSGLPFEFKCIENAFMLFYQVNFLLLIGSPEIHIDPAIFCLIFFDSFDYEEIFPKLSCILPAGQGGKVFKQVLAYAQVVEIDRKSTRLNSRHVSQSRMPSSA